MIRGTTPTHIFNVAFDASEMKCIKIVYAQDDEVIVKKKTSDCTITDHKIETTLTQEETFKFDCKKRVQIQLRIKTKSGVVLGTFVKSIPVEKCLDDEVLS